MFDSSNKPQHNVVYPKLSIIVPSYNQGIFIEETLLSIISQQYPNLELIIIDGGSSDNTLDIIKKYERNISYWISEKDNGQSHAINKGLQRATGEWIAWMNSDDCYLDGAFHYIFEELEYDQYDFIYGNTYQGTTIDNSIAIMHHPKHKAELKDILKFSYSENHIVSSQSVFIRRKLLDKTGLLDEQLHYCMDFDWYCRIYLATERRHFYIRPISFFRIHSHSKTGSGINSGYVESLNVAKRYLPELKKREEKEIRKYIDYVSKIHNLYKRPPFGLFSLLLLGIRYGVIARRHPRFLINLRMQLFWWESAT
jgi:glycosyltransferase involved in cell wall biosynthesis